MTERLTDDEIAELRRLEKAATPGDWHVLREDDDACAAIYVIRSDTGKAVACAGCNDFRCIGMGDSDSDLVVAARNAMPRLLDAYERMHRQMDNIADAFGTKDHDELCRRARAVGAQDEVLERLRADKERMDWLEGEWHREEQWKYTHGGPHSLFRQNRPITRERVDAARLADRPAEKENPE